MTFKENLLRKIEIERLASRVIASCGSEQSTRPVDKEAMRSLLELSSYQYQRERDLDLYVKPAEGEGVLKMILILDNKLPIFRSTIKDVVTRRSPRTLEMWNFKTVRNILVDSDIKLSTRVKSVETILKDAVSQLDLTYTIKDIDDLAKEGMAWLAGSDANNVNKILALFAALLGLEKSQKYFGLNNTISYGVSTPEKNDDLIFGPLVLYRAADNILVWIDQTFSSSDPEHLKILQSIASGQTSVEVTGDAVFKVLKTKVLRKQERVVTV